MFDSAHTIATVQSTTQSTNPSTAQSTPQPTTHSITQSTTQSMPDDADKPALNSYTFVIPEAEEWWLNWYNLIIDFPDYKRLETGQSFTFSRSCNPNLEFNYRSWKYSCETVETSPQFCSNPVRVLVGWASYNTYGHLETWLQCPQCGCGADGAANLNDLYAAEQAGSRKVSDVELLINDTFINNV